MPCPVFRDHEAGICLGSDPPAVRDPRPAITLIEAVARTPIETDPTHWADQAPDEEPERPADSLVGKVCGPLGLTPATPDNPMRLSIQEGLCTLTLWAACVAGLEREVGAGAVATASEKRKRPRQEAAAVVIRVVRGCVSPWSRAS